MKTSEVTQTMTKADLIKLLKRLQVRVYKTTDPNPFYQQIHVDLTLEGESISESYTQILKAR